MIGAVAPSLDAAVLEVGGGASALVDGLLDRGYVDITVVDLSEKALSRIRERLGPRAGDVRFVQGDARVLQLDRPVDVWHDRAVFHFLTAEEDRRAYLATLERTLRPGGHAVFGTFALDGPEDPDIAEVPSDALTDPEVTLPTGCITGSFTPFWGNMHAHTSNSDGEGTPAEAFAYARDTASLDFMIVTDHLEQLYLPSNRWNTCNDQADAANLPGGYVAMCGYEYGSGNCAPTCRA